MQLGARLHVDACVAAGAGGDSVDGILRRGLDSAAVAQSAQPAAGASRPRMESAWELHAVPLKGLLASVSAGYRW